jgi:hypothetical protein
MDSNLRSIFLHFLSVMNFETSREKFPYNAAWFSAVLQPALPNSWCAVSTAVNPIWVTSGVAVPTSACIFSDMTRSHCWYSDCQIAATIWSVAFRDLVLEEICIWMRQDWHRWKLLLHPLPFPGFECRQFFELSFGQTFVRLWPMT